MAAVRRMYRMTSAAAVLATLVICSTAQPHEQEVDRLLKMSAGDHNADSRYDANGHKVRNLDALGGGNLVRDARETHSADFASPYLMARRYEYINPFAGKRELIRPSYRNYGSMYADGLPKRNFDEIDRTGFDNFVKRNFDEIDRTGSMLKRNFDEIDRTGFDSFAKRRNNEDLYPLAPYALRFYEREH